MLKQDLQGEQLAIDRYKERILEDILIQEEEHKRDLLTVVES